MTSPSWIIDKSALARLATSDDAEEWIARIQRGLVEVATVTVLEVGYSAQTASDWTDRIEQPPIALMPVASLTPTIEERAVAVQGLLSRRGHHRAPSVPDLLIAAIAEADDLIVLHLDKDFELIADVTGQRVDRLRVSGHSA